MVRSRATASRSTASTASSSSSDSSPIFFIFGRFGSFCMLTDQDCDVVRQRLFAVNHSVDNETDSMSETLLFLLSLLLLKYLAVARLSTLISPSGATREAPKNMSGYQRFETAIILRFPRFSNRGSKIFGTLRESERRWRIHSFSLNMEKCTEGD